MCIILYMRPYHNRVHKACKVQREKQEMLVRKEPKDRQVQME